MTRYILLAEDYITELEEVHLIEDFFKCKEIERYDPITETWVRMVVNALRLKKVE